MVINISKPWSKARIIPNQHLKLEERSKKKVDQSIYLF